MRLPALFAIATLLLAIIGATAQAEPVATASDIDKAMNPLPPDVQKELNQPTPPSSRNAIPPLPPMSQHCRQLLAEIDRARTTPQSVTRDSYPQGPSRYYGRPPVAANTVVEGLQIDAGNGRAYGSNDSRRARLEAQFARECRT